PGSAVLLTRAQRGGTDLRPGGHPPTRAAGPFAGHVGAARGASDPSPFGEAAGAVAGPAGVAQAGSSLGPRNLALFAAPGIRRPATTSSRLALGATGSRPEDRAARPGTNLSSLSRSRGMTTALVRKLLRDVRLG